MLPDSLVGITAPPPLHHFRNAGDGGEAQPSWIQVLTTSGSWH